MTRARACRALAAAAALGGGLPGCGGSAAFLASPTEYAAYRATRVAPTFDGRLAAAGRYVVQYPRGAFAGEVRAYLDRAEPVFYEAKRGSIAGLEAYLHALPSGASSAEAESRLRTLLRARAVGDPLGRAAAATEARLGAEQATRRQVREELSAWVGRFLDARVWGRPLSEAPAELLVPFSLALPPPVCRALGGPGGGALGDPAGGALGAAPPGSIRCAKVLGLPYIVKVKGLSEPREATVEVAVLEDAGGRPVAVTIGGPDLFLRLEETRAVRALAADDGASRVGGISQAVELAGAAFRKRVSADPACRRQPVAPIALDLGCGGLRLVVRAALTPGGDDTIEIAPATP